ncbi:glycosyltransferase [Paenibacillus algorifonticola]|uniref:glycosyltransferase n=1 Tax=Paenibacillus algorifonticola TaxID=684063 RepID=UPI003D29D756
MSKIGVFLGFQSSDNLSIHGIGRLLAFFLKENEEKSNKIVLICPKWLIPTLHKLLKDHKISPDDFEIVTTASIPIGIRLKNYISDKKKKKPGVSKLKRIIKSVKTKAESLFSSYTADFFSTSSWTLLVAKILILTLLAAVASPFIIFVGIVYIVYKVLKFAISKLYRVAKAVIPVGKIANKAKSVIINARGVIYQLVIDTELNKLVSITNKRKDIQVCYIPSMVWPQIQHLNCKKVLAAPDIVFYDFPTQFIGVTDIHNRIRRSIASADHFISYSEYVKNHHLVIKSGVDPSKVTVIKHANIEMNRHLKISTGIQKYLTVEQNAQQIISNYMRIKSHPGNVLYKANFEKLEYIIYSSQYRPHKNIFSLIKAIKIVNKDRYRNIKLFLTGDIYEVDYIKKYIKDNHLENDIFVFHNISSEMLAALNQLANCAVNPTLFEGGFPFTFSEAYSVGTPSIMSNIPVVRSEIGDSDLQDAMLFDPHNISQIAEKIIWGVDHADLLFTKQKELYTKFSARDWKTVVNEYNQVFSKLLN